MTIKKNNTKPVTVNLLRLEIRFMEEPWILGKKLPVRTIILDCEKYNFLLWEGTSKKKTDTEKKECFLQHVEKDKNSNKVYTDVVDFAVCISISEFKQKSL